jgi:hypothetical protein
MTRADASTFHAYLDCQRRQPTEAPPTLRLALFDIGKIEQVKVDMQNATNGFESLSA